MNNKRLNLTLLRHELELKEIRATELKGSINNKKKELKALQGQIDTLRHLVDRLYQEFNFLREE